MDMKSRKYRIPLKIRIWTRYAVLALLRLQGSREVNTALARIFCTPRPYASFRYLNERVPFTNLPQKVGITGFPEWATANFLRSFRAGRMKRKVRRVGSVLR